MAIKFKFLGPFLIAILFYSCSTSGAGDASEAEAAEAASLSFVESSITTDGAEVARKSSQVSSLQTLNISDAIKNEVSMSISEIGNGIKYVQLETSAEALLGEIKKIVIDKNIYILDINGLFVFSPEGRFIRKIGEKGKGPNEYLIAFDFDVNSEVVGILDILSQKILQFHSDGNLNRIIKDFPSTVKLFLADSQYFLMITTPAEFWGDVDSGTLLYSFDTNEKNNFSIINPNQELHSSVARSYKYKNRLHFQQTLNDTIFSVSGDEIQEKYIIDLGKYKPQQAISKKHEVGRIRKTMRVENIAESNSCLFLDVRDPTNDITQFVYSKQNNKLVKLRDGTFKNDIDGGISFWPMYVTNDFLITPLVYIDLEEKDTKTFGPDLTAKFKKLDYNSNPILMIVYDK